MTAPRIAVRCGASVRRWDSGFFEGTWAGIPDAAGLAGYATVFGSGLTVAGDELLIVPPSHTHDGVYATCTGATVYVSNSIVALMARTSRPGVVSTVFCRRRIEGEIEDRSALPDR